MKKVYLVHVFRHGVYHHTCSIAFTSRAAAEQFAMECGEYAKAVQVELCSLSDF